MKILVWNYDVILKPFLSSFQFSFQDPNAAKGLFPSTSKGHQKIDKVAHVGQVVSTRLSLLLSYPHLSWRSFPFNALTRLRFLSSRSGLLHELWKHFKRRMIFTGLSIVFSVFFYIFLNFDATKVSFALPWLFYVILPGYWSFYLLRHFLGVGKWFYSK